MNPHLIYWPFHSSTLLLCSRCDLETSRNKICFWKLQSILLGSFVSGQTHTRDFPGSSVVKNLPANAGDAGSITESGRSSEEGNGYAPQYSCLENSMDRGVWWATIHRVTKGWTRSSQGCRDVSGTRQLLFSVPELWLLLCDFSLSPRSTTAATLAQHPAQHSVSCWLLGGGASCSRSGDLGCSVGSGLFP